MNTGHKGHKEHKVEMGQKWEGLGIPIDPARIEKGMWWMQAWSLVEGCERVSPGCDRCWSAAATHMRRKNLAVKGRYEGLTKENHELTQIDTNHNKFNGTVRLMESDLEKPLRVRRPTTFAIWNDLFHESVPFEFIDRALAVMALCPQHTFIALTKRAEVMNRYFGRLFLSSEVDDAKLEIMGGMPDQGRSVDFYVGEEGSGYFENGYLANLIPGITAENQYWFDRRWEHFKTVPAAVKVISYEPALGRLVLPDDFLALGTRGWVICGGETGPGARPMHPDCARGVRDQCVDAGVKFFFKSWGEYCGACQLPSATVDLSLKNSIWVNSFGECGAKPDIGGEGEFSVRVYRVGKARAGRLLDGREWNEMPEVAR